MNPQAGHRNGHGTPRSGVVAGPAIGNGALGQANGCWAAPVASGEQALPRGPTANRCRGSRGSRPSSRDGQGRSCPRDATRRLGRSARLGPDRGPKKLVSVTECPDGEPCSKPVGGAHPLPRWWAGDSRWRSRPVRSRRRSRPEGVVQADPEPRSRESRGNVATLVSLEGCGRKSPVYPTYWRSAAGARGRPEADRQARLLQR
jgi:hypothetical protein